MTKEIDNKEKKKDLKVLRILTLVVATLLLLSVWTIIIHQELQQHKLEQELEQQQIEFVKLLDETFQEYGQDELCLSLHNGVPLENGYCYLLQLDDENEDQIYRHYTSCSWGKYAVIETYRDLTEEDKEIFEQLNCEWDGVEKIK